MRISLHFLAEVTRAVIEASRTQQSAVEELVSLRSRVQHLEAEVKDRQFSQACACEHREELEQRIAALEQALQQTRAAA